MDFWSEFKTYGYWLYLAIAGYVGWNHNRIDGVIKEQASTRQDVANLKDTINHISNGVDMLTKHLLENKTNNKR